MDSEKKSRVANSDPSVVTARRKHITEIVLNRPKALNSLNLDMIEIIFDEMEKADADENVHLVIFRGAGNRGFCAGGDIKEISRLVKENKLEKAMLFFEKEYSLDLFLRRFSKPVVVLADGITMGGGLGIAAGADIVIATERTRMAMPESRIGFFPDVGATGWLFAKCPPGYAEYLGLTGYEMKGKECLRLGLVTHLIGAESIPKAIRLISKNPSGNAKTRNRESESISAAIRPLCMDDATEKCTMDDWVRTYFEGRTSMIEILADLHECTEELKLCEQVFQSISERSPTALALTLHLLRQNEGAPMDEVFQRDLKAARYMITHGDYMEGVRARVIEKDNNPRWHPKSIEEAPSFESMDII